MTATAALPGTLGPDLRDDGETAMLPGLPAEEVARRLARAGRREEVGQRVLAFYLVEMDERRLYQATGHGSTAHYAEARLDLDRRRTSELLRVGRVLLELTEVDRAFCAGRLGWGKVLVLARVAVAQHEEAWLERALALDLRALAALARRSRPGGPPRQPGDTKGLPQIRFGVSARVGVLLQAKLEQAQAKLAEEVGRPVGVADLLEALVSDFLASEADGTVPGRRRVDASLYRVVLQPEEGGAHLLVETEDGPLPVEAPEAVRCDADTLRSEGEAHLALDVKTPPALRRRVLTRDGGRCRACASRHGLMVHHLEHRAAGGRTSPENLLSLCTRCHGLVHEGLLVVEGATAGEARFVSAARAPLAQAPEARAAIAPPEGRPALAVVSLAQVPAVVDTRWWRRHAHLFRDPPHGAGLRFEAGTPRPEPEVEPEPEPVPTRRRPSRAWWARPSAWSASRPWRGARWRAAGRSRTRCWPGPPAPARRCWPAAWPAAWGAAPWRSRGRWRATAPPGCACWPRCRRTACCSSTRPTRCPGR